MPTPAEIRTFVDDRLATVWTALVNRQNAFFATHGRYWQGRRTHSADPSEGQETTPDRRNEKPADIPSSWVEFFGAAMPAAFPATLECHAYNGPQGQGFVAIVSVTIGGRTWRRSRQQGPETQHTHPWRRLRV